MGSGTMTGPKKRKEKEPENPNSVLNVLKRGFLPASERVDAQNAADNEEAEIKRKKANGEYDEED